MKRTHSNTIMVAIVSFLWSSLYYLNQPYLLGDIKPFVYRALVPMLAMGLELVGVSSGVSLVLVMTFSGVGFYLALRKLALEFSALSDWQELGIMVGVIVSMLLLMRERTPYDLMTAFLFTLGFYYIYTAKVYKYLALFILACVNRETSFLLILILAITWFPLVHKARDIFESAWLRIFLGSLGIFAITTYAIRQYFADYPGLSLWINPIENLTQLTQHPYQVISGILLVIGMGLWMFRKHQPAFLKMSFFILAPVLLVMWIVCGQWGELRVFWEVMPVIILLMVL
jgi:hypothetical protein